MNTNLFWNKLLRGGGIFFDLTKWIVVIIIVFVLINSFWVSIFVVNGISMEPNFDDGGMVLYSRVFYRNDESPKRGDVVVIYYPGDPDKRRYVKRVIGLPGEQIDIQKGKVYVNKKRLKERYIPVTIKTAPSGSWELNDVEFFVLGDNRISSNDSRYFGPVEDRFFYRKSNLCRVAKSGQSRKSRVQFMIN